MPLCACNIINKEILTNLFSNCSCRKSGCSENIESTAAEERLFQIFSATAIFWGSSLCNFRMSVSAVVPFPDLCKCTDLQNCVFRMLPFGPTSFKRVSQLIHRFSRTVRVFPHACTEKIMRFSARPHGIVNVGAEKHGRAQRIPSMSRETWEGIVFLFHACRATAENLKFFRIFLQ